jgi:hypothetical protein
MAVCLVVLMHQMSLGVFNLTLFFVHHDRRISIFLGVICPRVYYKPPIILLIRKLW